MRRSPSRAPVCRCTRASQTATRRRPKLERLEPRNLLTSLLPVSVAEQLLSGQAGVCNCPVCTGVGLNDIPDQIAPDSGSGGPSGSLPEGTLPILSSRPGATAKLFLDFNGHFQASWGSWTNANTPAYDTDGNVGSFSASEQAAMYEIWQRVAEDYAPFNIDVTTIDPGSQANQVVAHIAIGGHYLDWYGSPAGGVAYIGGFYDGAPNVGYVFENVLGNGNPKYIAEAASHEAGHLFGLQHQSKWSGGTLMETYHSGTGDWAPIMGVGYYVTRSTWHNGATYLGPTAYQDDLAIITGSSNGFGYVSDDYGSTTGAAANLPISGTSVNVTGLIGRFDDLDVFSFTTMGGTVNFDLAVDAFGPNLDAVLELWNSAGGVIATVAPGASYGASLSHAIGAGTFYLVARGMGDYADMGRYTITGTVPAASPAPEITVRIGATGITDGQTINFGSANVGTSVDRTLTVVNDGNATLNLTALNPGLLPAGFTIVSNLGSTSLAAGASTTFTLRFSPGAAGGHSGNVSVANNDSDENPFDLTLQGTGVATSPEITVRIGATGISDGQAINFGSANVGTSVDRTFTVVNDGNATLNLTALNPGSLPAGFSIVSNLGSTSLAAGASTTFTLRFSPGAAGGHSGSVALASNDSDENPFDLVLQGVGVVPSPEISVLLGSTNLATGGSVSFGTTTVGTVVTRTITIRNDGNATLNLTALDPATLPAGYSIVTNLGSTSLAGGQSTTLVLRLDAAAHGSFGGSIAISNSDSNENPFTLNLSGVVNATFVAHKQIIDVGNPGSSVTAGWTRKTGLGFEGDIHTATKGTGSKQTSWTFTGLPSGQYNVWATWTANSANATNAPFSFYNGSGTLPMVRVNQKQAPTAIADGAKWRFLTTITVNNGWAMVKLTNSANGTVAADAIRLIQLPPAAPLAAAFVHATGPASSVSSFLAFASSDHQHHDLPAVPLPKPAAEPQPVSSASHVAHDQIWSRSEDVRPESVLLEEAVCLLSFLRSSSSDDDSTSLALDHLLVNS